LLLAFNFGLRLQSAVSANVDDFDTPLAENATDQPTAMARCRILFTTHHGDSIALNAAYQALDSLDEGR
jgi:hypothetical protein